jgi:AhpC/TSA family
LADEASLEVLLGEQRARSAAKRTPELNATLSAAPERLRASGVGTEAPRSGDRAPDFALPNVHGTTVELGDLLGRGAVVLAFYRGVW